MNRSIFYSLACSLFAALAFASSAQANEAAQTRLIEITQSLAQARESTDGKKSVSVSSVGTSTNPKLTVSFRGMRNCEPSWHYQLSAMLVLRDGSLKQLGEIPTPVELEGANIKSAIVIHIGLSSECIVHKLGVLAQMKRYLESRPLTPGQQQATLARIQSYVGDVEHQVLIDIESIFHSIDDEIAEKSAFRVAESTIQQMRSMYMEHRHGLLVLAVGREHDGVPVDDESLIVIDPAKLSGNQLIYKTPVR